MSKILDNGPVIQIIFAAVNFLQHKLCGSTATVYPLDDDFSQAIETSRKKPVKFRTADAEFLYGEGLHYLSMPLPSLRSY